MTFFVVLLSSCFYLDPVKSLAEGIVLQVQELESAVELLQELANADWASKVS